MPTEIHLSLKDDYGTHSLEDAIIQAAANRVLETRVAGDGESEDGYVVPTHLARRLEEIITAEIREQATRAAPIVAEEILNQGVRRTDTWGDARGEPVPLKTVIAEQVKKELTHRSGSRGEGVLQKMITDTVQRELSGELKKTLDEAKAEVLKVVRDESSKIFQSAMAKALKTSAI